MTCTCSVAGTRVSSVGSFKLAIARLTIHEIRDGRHGDVRSETLGCEVKGESCGDGPYGRLKPFQDRNMQDAGDVIEVDGITENRHVILQETEFFASSCRSASVTRIPFV